MCGITGAFAISKLMNEPLPRLKEANEVLNKRGPNGGATYWHKRVSLGHRRLSIIDTSCAGDQPMHSLQMKSCYAPHSAYSVYRPGSVR